MYKVLFTVLLGASVGYGYGWSDAKRNTHHAGTRMIARAMGSPIDRARSAATAAQSRLDRNHRAVVAAGDTLDVEP